LRPSARHSSARLPSARLSRPPAVGGVATGTAVGCTVNFAGGVPGGVVDDGGGAAVRSAICLLGGAGGGSGGGGCGGTRACGVGVVVGNVILSADGARGGGNRRGDTPAARAYMPPLATDTSIIDATGAGASDVACTNASGACVGVPDTISSGADDHGACVAGAAETGVQPGGPSQL
jgi:hypothetical protein